MFSFKILLLDKDSNLSVNKWIISTVYDLI